MSLDGDYRVEQAITTDATLDKDTDLCTALIAAPSTLTLPLAKDCRGAKAEKTILNETGSAATLSFAAAGSDTIEGITASGAGDGAVIVSNGASKWRIIRGSSGTGATVSEAELAFADNTTANATAALHGLMPKLTPGVATASQPVTLGASKNLDVLGLPVSGLKIGAAGAEVAVDPSAAEFNVLKSAVVGTVVASKAVVVDASKNIARFETIGTDALDLSSGTPASHPINMESLTLPANSNAIRGASVNPTRTSGWISFSGTIGATPAQCYTDYRELHTTGVAQILGIGSFPFMDSGASSNSMFALQAICEVDAGAIVTTAAGAPAVGIFPIFAKLLLNGETFNPGGVAAAAFLAVQSNVTDVSTEDVSAINVENASGLTKSLLHLTNTANGFTNLLWLPDDGLPASLTNGSDLNDISATANAGWIKVLIGSTVRYIPLYEAKA